MKLKPIQWIILILQISAISLNLYAIFIKKVADKNGHFLGLTIVSTILILTLINWK